jgi:hypothetical protein
MFTFTYLSHKHVIKTIIRAFFAGFLQKEAARALLKPLEFRNNPSASQDHPMKKNLLALSLVLLIASGCGKNSGGSIPSYARFYGVHYQEMRDEVRAQANFNINDDDFTPIMLQNPSLIRFDNQDMQAVNEVFTYIAIRKGLPETRAFAFAYTDQSAQTVTQLVTIPEKSELILPEESADGISIDSDLELQVSGPELDSEESLDICFIGTDRTIVCRSFPTTRFTFDRESLQELGHNQDAVVQVMRSRFHEEPATQLRIVSSYTASPQKLRIK